MTRSPDCMPSSATVLQALHQLQYGGYRNVPIVDDAGQPLGVLDVLTLMRGAMLNQNSQPGSTSQAVSQWRGVLTSAESLIGVPALPAAAEATTHPTSNSKPAHSSSSRPASTAGSMNHSVPPGAPQSDGKAGSAIGAGLGSTFLFKASDHMSQSMSQPLSRP